MWFTHIHIWSLDFTTRVWKFMEFNLHVGNLFYVHGQDDSENTNVMTQMRPLWCQMMMVNTDKSIKKKDVNKQVHTQERIEKKQKAIVALAASEPWANGSSSGDVACHWLARKQKPTNHRKLARPERRRQKKSNISFLCCYLYYLDFSFLFLWKNCFKETMWKYNVRNRYICLFIFIFGKKDELRIRHITFCFVCVQYQRR